MFLFNALIYAFQILVSSFYSYLPSAPGLRCSLCAVGLSQWPLATYVFNLPSMR